MLISGLPLSMALKGGTKALEKAQELNIVTINDLSQARNGQSPKGPINKIIRALPATIKPFISMNLTYPTGFSTRIPNNPQAA